MRGRILYLERTADVARAVAAMLEMNRFAVTRADDDERAAERLKASHFDVVIVEIRSLPEDAGLRFLRHVNEASPHLLPRIVVISNDPPPAMRRELEAIGVCDIVLKPVHDEEILQAVEDCLDRMSATPN